MEFYNITNEDSYFVDYQINRSQIQKAGNKIGGLLRCGAYAWLAFETKLHIVSARNGNVVSYYDFPSKVTAVEELFPNKRGGDLLLAVCLEGEERPVASAAGGNRTIGGDDNVLSAPSILALYSLEYSDVISYVEVPVEATCIRFLNKLVCRQTHLRRFNGCLAIGSTEGVVLLLDLNVNKVARAYEMRQNSDHQKSGININLCQFEDFPKCQEDGLHFAVKAQDFDLPCAITCLLPIEVIMGLAVGLEDGRLAVYDLNRLEIFYMADYESNYETGRNVAWSPLIAMDYLEPPDDPRPCIYIATMHENIKHISVSLHAFMFRQRLEDPNGFYYFKDLQTRNLRLHLPLEVSENATCLGCQAISKNANTSEDDPSNIFAFSWYSKRHSCNKLSIFDLNQWYKAEMPYSITCDKEIMCLSSYNLNLVDCNSNSNEQNDSASDNANGALKVFINPSRIAGFNSVHRYEEHFYPNSLSFDCIILSAGGAQFSNWPGIQNRLINKLRSSNASIFLDPDLCFEQIRRSGLFPKFIELNINATFSQAAKHEVLLSVALKNNCYGLLKDCAKSWADGSFLRNAAGISSTNLTSTALTDWIWRRATEVKKRCNQLCEHLFDQGHNSVYYPLDARERKELIFNAQQLKTLSELYGVTIIHTKSTTSEEALADLKRNYESLCLASQYQELLLWLINIGLLPESSSSNAQTTPGTSRNRRTPLFEVTQTPRPPAYPYSKLKQFYENRRHTFSKINEANVLKKTGSCRLLYIDALIDHEYNTNSRGLLRDYWLENGGNGLYPPTTIEAMLRVMLIPNVSQDSKYTILLYFFFDLSSVLDEDSYKHVVENFVKFPSVFKLDAPLIMKVQAFWHLDHQNFTAAVDDFMSPFNTHQRYSEWLIELIVEALLTQDSHHLAVRILKAHSSMISPQLQIKTLLANDLISEAFHFARCANDSSLLTLFFKCCLQLGKLSVIRELALNEHEGSIVEAVLRECKLPGSENLHFVYLLQKSKYIDAVSYLDEISKRKSLREGGIQMSTPSFVVSAFNSTLAPVTQGLTKKYFQMKDRVKPSEVHNDSPEPLSCQLIKQNANHLLGGIYQSSALSAHFATYYYPEELRDGDKSKINPLSSKNAPFLRKPQENINYWQILATGRGKISYPQEYKPRQKQTLAERDALTSCDVTDNFVGGKRLAARATSEIDQPRKRHRTYEPESYDDVAGSSQGIQRAKHHFGYVVKANKTSQEPHPGNILMQPLLSARSSMRETTPRSVHSIPSGGLQGILKVNTPEPPSEVPRQSVRLEAPLEEEKNLRFKLPSTHNLSDWSTKDLSASESNRDETSQVMDSKDESMTTPKTKKVLVRSLSAESDQDMDSNCSKGDDDEYHSLVSTANNSMVVDSGCITAENSSPSRRNLFAVTSVDELPTLYETAREINTTLLDGPQPRKPLERLSEEHSEGFGNENVKDFKEPEAPEKSTAGLHIESTVDSGNSLSSMLPCTSTKMYHQTVNFPSISSKIHDFAPAMCSSKIGEMPSKTSKIIIEQSAKISERTTFVGTLKSTDFEFLPEPKAPEEQAYEEVITTERKTADQPMLDSTLGMSSYDVSIFDATTTRTSVTEEVKVTSIIEESENYAQPLYSNPLMSSIYRTALGSSILQDIENDEQKEDLDDNKGEDLDLLDDVPIYETQQNMSIEEVIELSSSSDSVEETEILESVEGVNRSSDEDEDEIDSESEMQSESGANMESEDDSRIESNDSIEVESHAKESNPRDSDVISIGDEDVSISELNDESKSSKARHSPASEIIDDPIIDPTNAQESCSNSSPDKKNVSSSLTIESESEEIKTEQKEAIGMNTSGGLEVIPEDIENTTEMQTTEQPSEEVNAEDNNSSMNKGNEAEDKGNAMLKETVQEPSSTIEAETIDESQNDDIHLHLSNDEDDDNVRSPSRTPLKKKLRSGSVPPESITPVESTGSGKISKEQETPVKDLEKQKTQNSSPISSIALHTRSRSRLSSIGLDPADSPTPFQVPRVTRSSISPRSVSKSPTENLTPSRRRFSRGRSLAPGDPSSGQNTPGGTPGTSRSRSKRAVTIERETLKSIQRTGRKLSLDEDNQEARGSPALRKAIQSLGNSTPKSGRRSRRNSSQLDESLNESIISTPVRLTRARSIAASERSFTSSPSHVELEDTPRRLTRSTRRSMTMERDTSVGKNSSMANENDDAASTLSMETSDTLNTPGSSQIASKREKDAENAGSDKIESYSESRRLTRTQVAKLRELKDHDVKDNERSAMLAENSPRPSSRRRTTSTSKQSESDGESVASSRNRRVTRSTASRTQTDMEDDRASVASSRASSSGSVSPNKRRLLTRRLRSGDKNSPVVLSSIPETNDSEDEDATEKKRGRK